MFGILINGLGSKGFGLLRPGLQGQYGAGKGQQGCGKSLQHACIQFSNKGKRKRLVYNLRAPRRIFRKRATLLISQPDAFIKRRLCLAQYRYKKNG